MERKLKWAILVIYSALVVLIGVMTFNYCHSQPKKDVEFPVEVIQNGDNNTLVQINGDNNIVNVNVIVPPVIKPSYREPYIAQIATIRWGFGDKNFTMQDALELLDKIEYHGKNNNISLSDALTIVNAESDFRADAYVESTQATGLTQSTPICLNEYNRHNGTNYTMEDLFDVDINLEVGFWYYNRILTHYADHYGYISTSTPEKALRDAYIAYNIGVTMFNTIGRDGRNELRNGVYPCNMYGSRKGDAYEPIGRYLKLAMDWS